jgi:hypothetical protein
MGRNNEDFSVGSGYWNDKSYGHVAPNGDVHPRRAFDRMADSEEAAGRPRPLGILSGTPTPKGW